jgi:hypothetical protein
MRLKGKSCANTCYTVMSGDGRVLGQWFLRSEDQATGSDWDVAMVGLCRRFEIHGFKPRLYYTDNYRKEYSFMTRIFPWLADDYDPGGGSGQEPEVKIASWEQLAQLGWHEKECTGSTLETSTCRAHPTVWYRGLSGVELVEEMRVLGAPRSPSDNVGTRAAPHTPLGVAIFDGDSHYERGDVSLLGRAVSIEWVDEDDEETHGSSPEWFAADVTDSRYEGSALQHKVVYHESKDIEWVDFDNKELRFDVVRTGSQHRTGQAAVPVGGDLIPAKQ